MAVYDNYGYYLFVPNYININNSEIANVSKCKKLSIDNKYLNENIVYIIDSLIMSIVSRGMGITCKICKEVCPYAEPNQADGTTLVGFRCTQNPYM